MGSRRHNGASNNSFQRKDTSFIVDNITIRPEIEASRLGRHYRRRPDRHPFIVDVPSGMFFPTRTMPVANTRYPVVIGESFWRLVAYIDSVPARREERVPTKSPHVLLRGSAGCGKSYLMTAASALLGFGAQATRPHQLSYLSADYRTIFIGDCRSWLESDDPLNYFRMELLAGLCGDCANITVGDHRTSDHLGCLVCVEPFTRVDQVRHFMEKCCRWVLDYQPDTLFVFFFDQAEELFGKVDSIPYQIISQLLSVEMPLLIFSVTTPGDSEFPFRANCGVIIDLPYRVTAAEFAKHVEVHSGPELDEKSVAYREVGWWKDVRLWTGSIPSEISELLHTPGESMAQKLHIYRRHVATRLKPILPLLGKLDNRQRNVLLIVIFAIILRVPIDMSGEFNLSNIMILGPSITNLLLLNCLQAFYHTSDGIVTMRDVPAAISMATHLALCSADTLNAVIRTWPKLFENVVAAMMHSKLLCVEAKRRMARFYAHAKLLWGKLDWSFEGSTEMGETVRISFQQPRVIVFAGQTPLPALIHPKASEAEHHGISGSGEYDSVVFIPGRTSYWFFDLFVLVPNDRRLYALTTSGVVGTWLKELQTRIGPMQLQQQREDGLLTPIILLDHWKEALRKAGLPKITVKCCVIKTLDFMIAAGYASPPEDQNILAQGSSDTGLAAISPDANINSTAAQLAKHLEVSVIIKDED